MEPLSPILNVATHTFVSRLFPLSFDVTDAQPYDDAAHLVAEVRRTGRLTVSSLISGPTIYADDETNLLARAWHDWVHFRYGLEFDLAGETLAAFVQLRHLVADYGTEYEAGALLLVEVLGQALYHERHGCFPVDQVAFAVGQMESGLWLSAARDLMDEMEEREASDRDAMTMARRDGRGLWSYILAEELAVAS